ELDLPAGEYRLTVSTPGSTGTYVFTTFLKPEAESFDFEVGQKVEPGKIGGAAVPGAGNLETTASKDVYSFAVAEGSGTVVFDSDSYAWPLRNGSKLVEVATGKDWGAI